MTTGTVVFQIGDGLAVRLIGDGRLPRGMRIRERREGDRIILEPMADAWPRAFLAAAGAWKGGIPRSGRDEPARDPFA
jgi:virulence-associated protein VagC